jgi:hypothetical protein
MIHSRLEIEADCRCEQGEIPMGALIQDATSSIKMEVGFRV